MSEVALSEYEIERNKPVPSFNHSIVQANLIIQIGSRYKNNYRVASELSLDLSDWPSVPDISIYPKKSLDLRNDIIAMTEPPLCVIEIISPSQTLNELIAKANDYFRHGVRSCWIVLLPLGNIYVFTSPDDYEIYRATETLRDPVLDISIPLKEVFE